MTTGLISLTIISSGVCGWWLVVVKVLYIGNSSKKWAGFIDPPPFMHPQLGRINLTYLSWEFLLVNDVLRNSYSENQKT